MDADDLDRLIRHLREEGRQVVGPCMGEGAILLGEIETTGDLPAGWSDEQEPGAYRLEPQADGAYFNHNAGPMAWKRFLSPPEATIWRGRRRGQSFEIDKPTAASPPLAFLGIRPCDWHAIEILNRVFLKGSFIDPNYAARRADLLAIVVECTHPGKTCFCASLGCGPAADESGDLALTEVVNGGEHLFVARANSARGESLLLALNLPEASDRERVSAARMTGHAAASMKRSVETEGLKDLLYRNYENPRWQRIAGRCLTCGNCTMVCPTCFCMTVQDWTDLDGQAAERRRLWDSCFTREFSYIHGGSIRNSAMCRYRQWLTHKFAAWVDQYGTTGCVGCGRCITWCPVGIDLTEELQALRRNSLDSDLPVEAPHD